MNDLKDRAEAIFDDHGWWICGLGGIAIGALVATAITSRKLVDDFNTERADLVEAHRVAISNKDVDIQAEKRKTEKALAEVATQKTTIATLEADKKAALDRLDADGDKMEIPWDLCPDSTFAAGGPTKVNLNGCSEIEIASSCRAVIEATDKPGHYEFRDCPLTDDDDLAYDCAANYDYSTSSWSFTECNSFPSTPGG